MINCGPAMGLFVLTKNKNCGAPWNAQWNGGATFGHFWHCCLSPSLLLCFGKYTFLSLPSINSPLLPICANKTLLLTDSIFKLLISQIIQPSLCLRYYYFQFPVLPIVPKLYSVVLAVSMLLYCIIIKPVNTLTNISKLFEKIHMVYSLKI